LRPGALDNLGLAETLRDSVTEWQSQHPGVAFKLEFSGKLDTLGEALNINIYRIVQEAVTNALRHAEATEMTIKLELLQPDAVRLTIADNGIGMIMCNIDQTKHFGLLGMRERVQSLRGKFEVESLPGNGTSIKVEIPV
jgi:hypothetical protein